MSGRNIAFAATTGSGKTLAYLLPAVHALKAAESKVEEFHSALVNEQAANKKLKAKLERSEAIIGKLVA